MQRCSTRNLQHVLISSLTGDLAAVSLAPVRLTPVLGGAGRSFFRLLAAAAVAAGADRTLTAITLTTLDEICHPFPQRS